MSETLDLDFDRNMRGYHFWKRYYRVKWALEARLYRVQNRATRRFPRLANEGAATARAIESAFHGYPMLENYRDKEEAVNHLQLIWHVMDDWDGSRTNVKRMHEGLGEVVETYRREYEEGLAKRLAEADLAISDSEE